MGQSQSTDKPDYMSYMARLSMKDCKNDEKFWTELIALAPPRNQVSYPFPRLMNEIGFKYPHNFIRLVLICVQHINLLKDGVSVSVFPEMILNQFSLSLLIFNACIETLIYNEKLIPILNRLDVPLAQIYIKSRPHLETYIQLSQRKKKEPQEINTENQTNENKEDQNNENQTNENKEDQNGNNQENQENENNENENQSNQHKEDENAEEQPQHINKAQDRPKINPIFESMQKHEGHIVKSMITFLSNSLFKSGLTLEGDSKDWSQTANYKILNSVRRDVVHCVYFLNSLDYFLPENMNPKPHFTVDMEDFPFDSFINSMCVVSSYYHISSLNEVIDDETFSLLQNCFGLLMRLFNTEYLANSFSHIEPSIFIDAFVIKDIPLAPLLFQPFDPLANETLSFLFISLYYQPNLSVFIANEGLSNKFIFSLMEALQVSFEQVGYCYLHSIIVSSILILASVEEAGSFLNMRFDQLLKSNFFPKDGSFADVLFQILFNICDSSFDFALALAAVFQMVVPQVHCFSNFTATKLIGLFEEAIKNGSQKVVSLLLEGFAEVVQNLNISDNMIIPLIVKNASLFESLKKNEKFDIQNNSLDIILTFISYVNEELKKPGFVYNDVVISLNTSKVFHKIVSFMKHPHILSDEIAAFWSEWTNISFRKSFEKELDRMTSLKMELDMQEKQYQAFKKREQERLRQEADKIKQSKESEGENQEVNKPLKESEGENQEVNKTSKESQGENQNQNKDDSENKLQSDAK